MMISIDAMMPPPCRHAAAFRRVVGCCRCRYALLRCCRRIRYSFCRADFRYFDMPRATPIRDSFAAAALCRHMPCALCRQCDAHDDFLHYVTMLRRSLIRCHYLHAPMPPLMLRHYARLLMFSPCYERCRY